MVVYSGRTVEQAIEKGLKDLNLPRMKAHIKVISREKKGFLGFGKKPARVSVEPINEKIAHEADQNTVKVALDAIKQLDDSVASPKDETIAYQPAIDQGFGKATEIEIQAKEMLRMREWLEETLAKHTGQDVEKIRRDIEVDTFLTAPEAKEYGIVDEVLEHRQ